MINFISSKTKFLLFKEHLGKWKHKPQTGRHVQNTCLKQRTCIQVMYTTFLQIHNKKARKYMSNWMRKRFKGLDVTDRVPDELWSEVCDTVQKIGIKNIPKKKKCQKAKWLSGEALQIAVKRREEKRKDIPIWMQSSKE